MLSVLALMWTEGYIVLGKFLPAVCLVLGFLMSLVIFSDGGGK